MLVPKNEIKLMQFLGSAPRQSQEEASEAAFSFFFCIFFFLACIFNQPFQVIEVQLFGSPQLTD